MFSSSFARTLMIDYIESKICHLCGLKSEEEKGPLNSCKECGLVSHRWCFEARFGKQIICCAKGEASKDLYCSICSKQGSVYVSKQLEAPTGYHLLCSFDRGKRLALLREASGGSQLCVFCEQSFNSPLYSCMQEKEGCRASFHLNCYQYFVKPIDCVLEERLLGEVMVCCSQHLDSTRVALYRYYRLLEVGLPAMKVGKESDTTRSQGNSRIRMEIEEDGQKCGMNQSRKVEREPFLVLPQQASMTGDGGLKSIGQEKKQQQLSTANKRGDKSRASSKLAREQSLNLLFEERTLEDALARGTLRAELVPYDKKNQDNELLKQLDDTLDLVKTDQEASPNLDLMNSVCLSEIGKDRSFYRWNPQQSLTTDQSMQQLLSCFPKDHNYPSTIKEPIRAPQENKIVGVKAFQESANMLIGSNDANLPPIKGLLGREEQKSVTMIEERKISGGTKGLQTWEIIKEADERIARVWNELETCDEAELLYEVKGQEELKRIRTAFEDQILGIINFLTIDQ
jgi:hypothetical protein